MKLLNIIFISIGLLLALHSGIRIYGKSNHYRVYNHPLVNNVSDLVYKSELNIQNHANEISRIKQLFQQDKNVYLDLHFTADNKLVVFSEDQNSSFEFHGHKRPTLIDFAKALSIQDEELELESFLKQNFIPYSKNNHLILNMKSYWPGINVALFKVIDSLKIDNKIIFTSEYGNTVRNGREERPYWLFANSRDEFTKANILNNIYLESVAPMDAHVWILPIKLRTLNLFSQRLVDEALRRHKKIYLLGINSEEDYQFYSQKKNLSIITANYDLFLKYEHLIPSK